MNAAARSTPARAPAAGLLMYRHGEHGWEVLLVHPGGPFWRKRDAGAWSIPKGAPEPGEDDAAAALREFHEETGALPTGVPVPLGRVRQKAGKEVVAFALPGDFDPATLRSNTFELEWPPRSGRLQAFPEVDRAEWFDLDAAREKLIEGQRPLIERLQDLLRAPG
ncbi:MAG: NUDIX hydrolase [Bordetella sp. SCN 67-23]|nr:NUDIX domain-containing protein [Burkholderiales bacterium]ODS72932.1 MAG: NUDIX hydrolase [Bordetella sp. SCN 67-23]ODU95705.1 MAG: NUDIX hydrolase [Bordetella sp. SCN 68-11]OJW93519.1 MAG: NUDIX hydrolase [Burkholderiales bacterium 67-32]